MVGPNDGPVEGTTMDDDGDFPMDGGTFNSEVQHSRLLMVFSSQDVFWAGC